MTLREMRWFIGIMSVLLLCILVAYVTPVQAQEFPECTEFGGIDVTSIFLAVLSDDEDDNELASIMLENLTVTKLIDTFIGKFAVTVYDIEDTNGIFIIFDNYECIVLYMKPKAKEKSA